MRKFMDVLLGFIYLLFNNLLEEELSKGDNE